jgi:hypothetical protein
MEHANEGEVPVAFGVVEAVAHDEQVGDMEADVVGADRFAAAGGLLEEDADAKASRVGRTKARHDRSQRLTRVKNVVDDEDIPSAKVESQFLGEYQFAGFGMGAVTGDAEKIEFDRQSQMPEQIGEEKHGSVEEGDDGEFASWSVSLDLVCETAHSGGNPRSREEDTIDFTSPSVWNGAARAGPSTH